jgi:Tol biopolymer transport system component
MSLRRRMATSGIVAVLLATSACTGGTEPRPTSVPSTSLADPLELTTDVCVMPENLAPAPRLRDLRGRIAYGRGTDEVEVLDLATGRVTQVTSRAGRHGWDFDPSFSPDHDRIAYRSEFPGDAEIRVVELSTGEDRALTANDGADWSPAYSPDGRTLAYATDRRGFMTEIAVMPADGDVSRIVAPNVHGEYPTWSPDGERLAFASQVDPEYDILVVDADGSGEPMNLTEHPAKDFLPAWSPDGETIVFQSDRCATGERSYLFAMDADGSNVRRLTRGFAEMPEWSPDGRWLVFNAHDGLSVMEADGGEARSLGVGTGILPDWTTP